MVYGAGGSRLLERVRHLLRIDLTAVEEELKYLEKWLGIAILVGIVSGIGAVIFHYSIEVVVETLLGGLGGYYPPKPGSESLTFVVPEERLLLPLVPLLGGILSGLLVYKLAPEAEGHGTDAVISAFHYKEGAIRSRVPLVKLAASAITIGSGGSAGKEGPVAQIGGGFASLLAGLLRLSPRDRRIAAAVGMGSGIGAIFKAPFGGAIFAAEVLYLMDFEPYVIPPALISSLVSYTIMGFYSGWDHVFWTPNLGRELHVLYEPPMFALFAVLGLLNGLAGILHIKLFYGVKEAFDRLRIPRELKPAVGGALTGLIALFLPHVMESSYGWLQMAICGDFTYLPLYVLIALPLLKMLATAFSIGSGGSGGVFAPSLVIGGSVGALIWHLVDALFPEYEIPAAAFVVVGMMSFFGGVGKVPIATTLMVGEMTGAYELIAPSLVATAISYVITGPNSIYRSQVHSRAESPAHGRSKVGLLHIIYEKLRLEEPMLLYKTKAEDLMVEAKAKISCRDKARDVVALAREHPYRIFPVVDGDSKFLGFVALDDILSISAAKTAEVDVMLLPLYRGVSVRTTDSLKTILEKMIENEIDKVAVVDEDLRLRGIITAKEILRYLLFEKMLKLRS